MAISMADGDISNLESCIDMLPCCYMMMNGEEWELWAVTNLHGDVLFGERKEWGLGVVTNLHGDVLFGERKEV